MAPPNIPEDADPSQVQKQSPAHSAAEDEDGGYEDDVPAITGEDYS